MLVILSFLLIAVLAKNAFSLVSIYPQVAHTNHEKGIYLVEFPIDHVNSKESISAHLESKLYDRNKVAFRTKTETDLFHGHSFFLDQEHDEVHIASIPGAINIYRVKTISRSPTIDFVVRGSISKKSSAVIQSDSVENIMNKTSTTTSMDDKNRINTLAAVPIIKADDVHLLTGVHDARSKLGLKGKGIRIAVIDNGVYYKHPALGGCFGPGCRISFGYDLVGDNFIPPTNTVLAPDPYPFDNCSGFGIGTMAMGIIMGNATGLKDGGFDFTGVAPEATVGMYRIFGCNGGISASTTSSDVVLSAVLMAAQADAHIITLSIQDQLTYPDDPLAVAISRVSAAGHIVVFSSGDSVEAGLFSSTKLGDGPSVFSVATFFNSYGYADRNIKVNGVQFPFQTSFLNISFSYPDSLDIVVNNLTAYPLSINDACDPATIKQATAPGQTLLIYYHSRFTICTTFDSCTNAANKGYAKCLVYTPIDEYLSVAGTDVIASAVTTPQGGLAIVAAIKSGNKNTFIIDKDPMLFAQTKAGQMTDFSNLGMDYELNIKPDFGVIGGQLFTTIDPLTQSSFGVPSPYLAFGQWLSSAYATGCIALLLQAYGGGKSLNFNQIKTLLQNSAKPANIYGSPMTDSVANQGAGLINVYDAIMSKISVYPSNLALNDTQYTKPSYELKITNNEIKSIVYNLASVGAATAYSLKAGDDAIQIKKDTKFIAEYAKVEFKNSYGSEVKSITVAARTTVSIKVEFKPPATAVASLFPIYSGYISISSSNSAAKAIVPYAGMLGKFSDFPIWSRQSASFSDNFLPGATTGLFNITTSAPIASNAVVSSAAGISILPIFETGTRYYKVEVLSGKGQNYVTEGFALVTTDSSSLVLQGANHPRNDYLFYLPPTLYTWNGYVCKLKDCTVGKKLSPGYYRMKFTALKHYAPVNSKYDSDYDIVVTPAFVLDTTAMPSIVPSTAWPSKKPARVPTYKPKEEKEKPSSKHSSTAGLQSSSSVDGSSTDVSSTATVATIAGVSAAMVILLILLISYFCFYRNKTDSRINSEMLKASTLGQDDKTDVTFSPDNESFSQINFISKF